MRNKDAVLSLAKEKAERIERTGRAHPGKFVGTQVNRRSKPVGKGVAHPRVNAVSTNHETRLGEAGAKISNFGAQLQLHPQGLGAVLQHLQENAARTAAKAV